MRSEMKLSAFEYEMPLMKIVMFYQAVCRAKQLSFISFFWKLLTHSPREISFTYPSIGSECRTVRRDSGK